MLSAFGQGSIAIKSAEQGTGLGLPIVQAILAKHNGEFILKSKLREGTEAIAILPGQAGAAEPAARARRPGRSHRAAVASPEGWPAAVSSRAPEMWHRC